MVVINLKELLDNVQKAKALVQDAEDRLSDAELERDSALRPILKELEASFKYHYVDEVNVFADTLSVSTSYGDCYDFPLSIFEAEDPVAAAKEYKAKQQAVKDEAVRKEKLLKLKQLQKELGIE